MSVDLGFDISANNKAEFIQYFANVLGGSTCTQNFGHYEHVANSMVIILFKDINDDQGEPFLGHLRSTADRFTEPRKRALALFHDLEDTDYDHEDLRQIGFDDEFVATIAALSNRPINGQTRPYLDYMVDLCFNDDAMLIKDADSADNSDPARRPPDISDDRYALRMAKYSISEAYRRDVRSGIIKPGTPFHDWYIYHVSDEEKSQNPDWVNILSMPKYCTADYGGPLTLTSPLQIRTLPGRHVA